MSDRDQADESIKQKRFGVRIRIACGPESLHYSIDDYSGGRSFYAPYETLELDSLPTFNFGNMLFFRRLLTIPLAIVVVSILTINNTPLSEGLAYLAMLCFTILLLAKFFNAFSVRFTQIPMRPAPPGSDGHLIRIIQGQHHDAALASIRDRWKARMLILHGEVDPNADPEKETAKFQWLRERGIICDETLRTALAKVEALARAGSSAIN